MRDAFRKPILCLDFDGVLHSYTSGWRGARCIPDEPVPGMLRFLVEAQDHFEVCILSSRSHQFGGRRAMKRWLRRHLAAAADGAEPWAEGRALEVGAMTWEPDMGRLWAAEVVKRIGFPREKPPATVTIDDRAITFDGTPPCIKTLRAFRRWNR